MKRCTQRWHALIAKNCKMMLEDINSRHDALINTGSSIIKTGYTVESGSTVNSVVIAMQLNGGYSNWQNMVNATAEILLWIWCSRLLRTLLIVGICTRCIMLIMRMIWKIMSFIINGVVGQVSDLPSGKWWMSVGTLLSRLEDLRQHYE